MRPRKITVRKDAQQLYILWEDGIETLFGLDPLRKACPCAGCLGHENMGSLPDPEIFLVPSLMSWNAVRVEAVGTYAIRVVWDDGHDSGIYTWDRLRQLHQLQEAARSL